MSPELTERLNSLHKRILKEDVRSGRGLGNELGFFIFDYDPSSELDIRQQIPNIIAKANALSPDLKIAEVDVFEQLMGVLEDQDLLERALELEDKIGLPQALEAIRTAATPSEVAARIVRLHPPGETDLYILHNIGDCYPLIRAHAVLTNLHTPVRGRSVILFFPGKYSGRRLSLFNALEDSNYYRAFRLFDEQC